MSGDDYAQRFQAAVALHRQGRLAEAEPIYRALVAERALVSVTTNLAAVLRGLERPAEAVELLERTRRAAPDDLGALYNLANALNDLHRWDEAEAAYRELLARDPTHAHARLNLGHLLLSHGRWTEGWPLYDQRLSLPDRDAPPPITTFPRWRGEPLEGKSILISAEQGLGDQIMFSRFTTHLRARGARKIGLASLPALVPLMGPLADEIVPLQGQAVVGLYDYWIAPGSLPGALGLTLEDLSGAPYLAVPPSYADKWRDFAKPGVNVGVIWHGNPMQKRDRWRSLPDPRLLDPLKACGATLVDLQEPLGDFADLAAVMAQMDLLISVDTGPAHLAAALGRPTWILYPWAGTDWRWMWERRDSPWYDSVTLYRQPAPDAWEAVVAEVARDLSAWVAERRAGQA